MLSPRSNLLTGRETLVYGRSALERRLCRMARGSAGPKALRVLRVCVDFESNEPALLSAAIAAARGPGAG
jgi:hypothetical protein